MKNAAVLVHGGAGGGTRDAGEAERRCSGCLAAARGGWRMIEAGGSAVEAVEAAVGILEDDPEFNAGTGSVLNRDGRVETDAAIMDGVTLAAGAIGAVQGIRNPIRLARAVMEKSPHVLLVGEGALAFARAQDFEFVDPQSLIVSARRERWEQSHGTVGAVVRDREGRLAAATSTGGISLKLPGRIGDAPLIGCGTYADGFAAVSATGTGEAIIRVTLARLAAFALERGATAQEAADQAIARFAASGLGEAGLIVIGAAGGLGFAYNSASLARAGITTAGEFAAA